MNQRGASALGIVIIVLLVGAVGWFGWSSYKAKSGADASTTGSFSGWKSYRDASSGVTFKYPPTWNVFAYQPEQGTNAGKFNLLTISPVTQQQRTGPNAKQYTEAINLLVTISDAEQVEKSVTPANPLFRQSQPNERTLENFTMNGGNFSLRGYGTKSAEPLVAVEVVTCKADKSCSAQIKRTNGNYVSAIIAAQGNQQQATTPVDTGSEDYIKSKMVLQSMKF
ncbi:MAG TPA: hypothetical protein VF572_00295 [Candidatus Saccharimonadales bacterium]